MSGKTVLNNGILEKDISIMEADEYYWDGDNCVVGINAENKKEAEQLKQQILNNQAIVEKIQSEINKEPRAYVYAGSLQKILDNTLHSECPGEKS